MAGSFDFKDLFVLDMANNHQGSLQHGRKIIRAMAEVVHEAGVRAAIKFQFRQLDTFIHPSHREGSDLKFVKRFQSTRLKHDEFKMMLEKGSYDIYQPDATIGEGISDTLRVIEACREQGLDYTPHTWTNGIGFLINLHVYAAGPRDHPIEYPYEPPG